MNGHSREVQVFVRIRPTENLAQDLIECLPDGQTLNIYQRKDSRKVLESRRSQLSSWSFRLEGVLHNVSQEEVYTRVCKPVVLGALDGYNGTVMCFGQTGSGKTYTMTGSTESYKQRGIIPRALQEVFQKMKKRSEHAFSVYLSYLEIYNETLVDLLASPGSPHLSPRPMVVMEEPGRGVFIRGLSRHPIHSEEEALNLLFEGEMNRIIGSHSLNRKSSRSHCILTVYIESRSQTLSDANYITSKLNLVDLAGSERLAKTGSEGQMLKEAMYINKSLSFLEQAILALANQRREHIPFRQTKLTHALKDSLGGNCNTVLVANIYGEAAQIEETLSTLRFASRMKCVQTNPAVNEHTNPAVQIKKLQKEVQMLKDELSIYSTPLSRANRKMVKQPGITYESLSEAQLAEIQSQVQRYLEGSLEEISVTNIRQIQAVFAQFKLAVHEQKQKVKAQLCQTCNLMKKDQSGGVAAVTPQERDTRSMSEDVDAGCFVASAQSQNLSHVPVLTKAKTKETNHTLRSLPTKAEAFEDFKVGRGSEISLILKENKAVLLERRSLLRQLAEEVSAVKREISCTTATLQQQEDVRRDQGQYLVMNGAPVLQEQDAFLLVRLRELQAQYHQRYEALCDLKAEVNYCQHLVDQCKVRLLSEFETWYEQSFLSPEEELGLNMDKNCVQVSLPHSQWKK